MYVINGSTKWSRVPVYIGRPSDIVTVGMHRSIDVRNVMNCGVAQSTYAGSYLEVYDPVLLLQG